ncbi:putative bifunctional diguanylate cyclase/phosphodiesterase [Desulfonatronovibrio magnus]|uniref:putative bifunctional diguanylate cyclase/phosphodiesterase n=1 Tax=Desulfonatronovibrio magnus TaxID=698827 RepID=UPI0006970378|nr:EAL domain-containing protein [Desulfonatronovibrio magnus]
MHSKIIDHSYKPQENSIEELKNRINHLEEINRFTLDALELAASLMDFQPGISNLDTAAVILEETCSKVARLMDFKCMAIYLVNEEDSDFNLSFCQPMECRNNIEQEVDHLIEQGFFAWAMREKHPLRLASSMNFSRHIVLNVMSTSSRVRGMFVGFLQGDSSTVPDVSWSLLNIVMISSANALESFELYKIFKEANVELKKSVMKRTRQLEVQSTHDQLTHLPNRDMIFKKLEQLIRKYNAAEPSENNRAAFLLIDLDMFKEVNEALGHEVGDKLLIQVGFRLLEIVKNQESIGRLGGDEFAIILTGPKCRDEALLTARNIIKSMRTPFNVSNESLVLDVSMGIAMYPDHGTNLSQILSKADVAMYASKRRKTGYTLYSNKLESSGINRLSLMGELKKSLDNDELTLYYQPKIRLDNEKVCGAEALIRWIHPSRGFIPPDEFIPLAEQGGLIRELTSRVISMAVNQIRQWADQGLSIPLSVNLSVRDLQESSLPEKVFLTLQNQAVHPKMLEMEITESAFVTAPEKVKWVLNALNETGVILSIDDFGTGYSSIAYLKDLPVKILKIDRSFVMKMHKERDDAVIVKSIIDLGHNLGLKTVAEGVENDEILSMLKNLGCDMAQGYHIMKPAPPDAFTAWVKGRHET